MDSKLIHDSVCAILKEIQAKQGLDCPELQPTTKPLDELPRFDSPMSIAATGKISRRLGIEVPPGTNLFGDKHGKYDIAATVALLGAIVEKESKETANV